MGDGQLMVNAVRTLNLCWKNARNHAMPVKTMEVIARIQMQVVLHGHRMVNAVRTQSICWKNARNHAMLAMEVTARIQMNMLQVVLDGHLMVNAAKTQDSC